MSSGVRAPALLRSVNPPRRMQQTGPELDEIDERPITLLVVESNAVLRLMVAERLRSRGYSVETMGSRAEALLRIEEDGYDAVILGWELSDARGIDLLRDVRARHAAADMPVIMLSDREDTDDVVRAFDRGASDFISRPINFAIALARIHSHVSLRRARLALARQALVDELTHLYNRRHIMAQLGMLVSSALRYGHELSLCIGDVDLFKHVNDTYGHLAGDLVLTHLAGIVRERVRKSDVPGRFGGDELCVVFPHTSSENAVVAVEHIRKTFAESRLVHEKRQLGRLTASFGIAQLGGSTDDVASLVAAADLALYRAKELGRNRICTDAIVAEPKSHQRDVG